jgi:hypothetical protein
MALRVKDGGESQCRSVMDRIRMTIIWRESALTSSGSNVTRELDHPI